jgi:hypothetical protein
VQVLTAAANSPESVWLTDRPKTFPLAWPVPGWNVHSCHSHLHDSAEHKMNDDQRLAANEPGGEI